MSSYLQRLLDTGAPSVSVAPTVQSTSPIAENDQRLLSSNTDFFDATSAPAEPLTRSEPDGAAAPVDRAADVRAEQSISPQRQIVNTDVATDEAVPLAEETSQPLDGTETEPETQAARDAVSAVEAPRGDDRREPVAREAPLPYVSPVSSENAAEQAPGDAENEPETIEILRRDTVIETVEVAHASEVTFSPALDPATESSEGTVPDDIPEETSEPPPSVDPAPAELAPLPPLMPPIVEEKVERVVEREVVAAKTVSSDTPTTATPVSTGPRTAASLSKIGALPHRQKIRRINGLRWR